MTNNLDLAEIMCCVNRVKVYEQVDTISNKTMLRLDSSFLLYFKCLRTFLTAIKQDDPPGPA